LIPTNHRVVPLTHYLMGPDRLYTVMDSKGNFLRTQYEKAMEKFEFIPSKLNQYLKRLNDADLLPAFFFCFSREKCEKYAAGINTSLVDAKTSSLIDREFKRCISKFGDRYNGMR